MSIVIRCLVGLGAALALPFASGASEALPELRGVMSVAGEWQAAFAAADTRAQRWCRTGERIGEFTVAAITVDAATLIDAAGTRHIARLPAAKVRNTQAPPAEPAAWQRWVNSADNPMLHQPAELPVDVQRWAALPDNERRATAEWYRAHGWELKVAADERGVPLAEFSPLQGDARQAILAEKRATFQRSLTPVQRTLYVAAQRGPAEGSVDAMDAFRTSLAPLARAAFNDLTDFTAPLPVGLRSR
jgi:hypothetical protein